MPDPFTDWLTRVDADLTLIAHISVSLKTILHNMLIMLRDVLGMILMLVWGFRRGKTVSPVGRCKPATKRRRKRGRGKGRNASI